MTKQEENADTVWVGLRDNTAARKAALRCIEQNTTPEEGEGDLWNSEEPDLVLWLIAKEMEAYEQTLSQ